MDRHKETQSQGHTVRQTFVGRSDGQAGGHKTNGPKERHTWTDTRTDAKDGPTHRRMHRYMDGLRRTNKHIDG